MGRVSPGSPEDGAQAPIDRRALEGAFGEIATAALEAGRIVEFAVYGGSALLLTLEGRAATRDLDAVILSDPLWLRHIVRTIAASRGWPDTWLNDGVKGFLSARDAEPDVRPLFRTYPDEATPGLRVYVAAPEYLFAMKCLAMRIGGVDITQDRADIEALARHLQVETSAQAIAIVSRFYPRSRISPKTQFGIEEIFGAWEPEF